MDLDKAIAAVESSGPFAAMKKEHPKAYFVHAFSMEGPDAEFNWQLGYFLPSTKKIVVFNTDPVSELPADDAYTKGETIKPLEMAKVKVAPEAARRAALNLKEANFPAETVTKVIMILQNLDCQMYNLTLVTHTFNILNVKVDAATGEVLSSEMRSIMSLRRQ